MISRFRWLPALLALALTLGAAPGALALPPSTPAALEPCPFTPAEVSAALGLQIVQMEVADMQSPGARDVGCFYEVQGSETVLSVRQTWDPGAGQGRTLARGAHTVPGDPDGAEWRTGTKDEPSAELLYTRGRVRTRLLVHGGSFDPEEVPARLLRMRRVP